MVACYPRRPECKRGFYFALFIQPGLAVASVSDARHDALTVRENVYRAFQTQQQRSEEAALQTRAGAGAKLAQALGQDASADRLGAVGGTLASGLFSSAVQQGLAPFGTARARLNLSSAHFDGSEFDFFTSR
ncbi:inverse autotransporter beta domain-containing protein [Pantoea tagorei]